MAPDITKIVWPAGPFFPVKEPASHYGKDVPEKKKVGGITYKDKVFRLRMRPGEGISAAPFEAEELIDLTFPMGAGSGAIYGIIFQLGKWGYDTAKVNESIEVSPVFTEYYQKTIVERQKLEEQLKAGFASLANAVTDFELLAHDARKYKEYMKYFQAIEQKKKALEKIKGKDENLERELREANHILRALFVDYVDAHAGEGIALRTIAPRWPTIISDFMELNDDEDNADKITKRLPISKAEAVILATKNKLYNEWKSLFYGTVKGRYERLLGLMKAREESIREYREQMKPLLYKYKSLKEGTSLRQAAFYRPDAQAVSVDHTEIWAWRPFVIPEIFKLPREQYDTLTYKEAGFTREEIKEMKKDFEKSGDKLPENIPRLPAIPVMDDFVRAIIAQAEEEYKVKITMKDVYETIEEFSKRFTPPARPAAIKAGIKWPFSPYFIFVVMAIDRTIIKLPNGETFEDIWIEPLKTINISQNIMLGRLLTLKAKNKADELEVARLLGEKIIPEGKEAYDIMDTSEAVKEEFPEIFGEESKKEEKTKELFEGFGDFKKIINDIKAGIGNFLGRMGINAQFAYAGPYEKFMFERMTKMMQLAPGIAHITISEFLKKAAGVPGAEVKAWL